MNSYSPEERRRLALANEVIEGSRPSLYRHAVTILDTDGQNTSIASGTLVSILDRVFIATAGHCIPSNPQDRLWFLIPEPTSSLRERLQIINRGSESDVDVGFLELNKTEADDYFQEKEYCELSQLTPSGPGREKALVTLVGNAAERIDHSQQFDGLPAVAAKVDSYSSVILSVDEWPSPTSSRRPPNIEVDMYLDYPEQLSNLDSGTEISASNPGGLSGGALWDMHAMDKGLWTPDCAKIVGIQSAWHPTLRYLRITQIVHWIRLLHDSNVDLQEHLAASYPAVFGTNQLPPEGVL